MPLPNNETAEEKAKREAEEAKRKAEAEAKKKAEEEARRKAEEEAKRKAEEIKKQEEARQKEKQNYAKGLVEKVSKEYDKKLADQKAFYEKELKDRDDIIAQTISKGKDNHEQKSVSDRLNEKRNRELNKKW